MLITSNCPIILASTSKIRKKLLKQLALKFSIQKPLFDEDHEKKYLKNLSCKQLSMYLATQKALSISQKFPDAIIIGSDQVCEFENEPISKSKSFQEAISQLKKFNGKTHYQNNSVVIVKNNKVIFKNFSKVKIKMRKLTESEIKKYVDIDKSWGCAGSYKYESMAQHLFEKVEGDYFSVLGIAIQPLLNFLYKNKIIKF
jgi:septum formation protein